MIGMLDDSVHTVPYLVDAEAFLTKESSHVVAPEVIDTEHTVRSLTAIELYDISAMRSRQDPAAIPLDQHRTIEELDKTDCGAA